MYSTLRRDSGLLEANRISKNTAFVEQGVLLDWKKEERRAAKNVLDDVKYTLTARR